ncbi:MAG: hypothetical protein JSW64_15155 [Candidatus Zixiibacteriota bacterium]|nr:MAG: hypothetical protein JSW64_15155 [candidate division Zixibacteria bacterium]
MDYMQLVKTSIVRAWRYRFLWFFGFFVTVTDGFGGFHWLDDRFDKIDRFHRFSRFEDLSIEFDPAFLIMLGLLVFSLWIIFWVMNVISEGSLIHGVSRKEMNLGTSFSECWSAGLKNFLRLFGIILLITLLTVFVIIGSILFIIPAFILSVPLGVVLSLFALPVIFAVVVVAVSVEGWAIRYAVLNDEPWLTAIKKGWFLFKDNIWKTVAIALLSFFTQLVLWCFLVIVMVILALPFIIMGYVYLWLGLIPGLFTIILVIILSAAFFGVFASTIWTLGFMRLTNYKGLQVEENVNYGSSTL